MHVQLCKNPSPPRACCRCMGRREVCPAAVRTPPPVPADICAHPQVAALEEMVRGLRVRLLLLPAALVAEVDLCLKSCSNPDRKAAPEEIQAAAGPPSVPGVLR